MDESLGQAVDMASNLDEPREAIALTYPRLSATGSDGQDPRGNTGRHLLVQESRRGADDSGLGRWLCASDGRVPVRSDRISDASGEVHPPRSDDVKRGQP